MPGISRGISMDSTSSLSDSGKENTTTFRLANQWLGTTKRKSLKVSNLTEVDEFSLEGVPKIEAYVSPEDLPDFIKVFDKGNITNLCPDGTGHEPVFYKRVYPKDYTHTKHRKPRVGKLFLHPDNLLAEGRRSSVHRAPLVATLGPRSEERKRVSVAVKTADSRCRSHHLLREEAKGYSAFPREFFRDPNARRSDTPLASCPPEFPSGSVIFPDWAAAMRAKTPTPNDYAPPILPAFYGFYVPIDDKQRSLCRTHADCNSYSTSNCSVPRWPKSILLMEDCGEQIDPDVMTIEHKKRCLALVERMHRAGFSHGCPRPSNILVQPGPLSVPLEYRSMDEPSFRLISLGRWRGKDHPLPKESALTAVQAFRDGKCSDVGAVMGPLGLCGVPL